jgi:hypothetical protein
MSATTFAGRKNERRKETEDKMGLTFPHHESYIYATLVVDKEVF